MRRASNVSVRVATVSDAPAMASLREASGWSGGAPEATMARYLAGTHHPQQALAPRVVLLAEVDEALVGYAAGHLTERFGCGGELQWLLVHPAHRGSDVATRLVGGLAVWFREQRVARVCVNVAPDNVRARRFYHRLGAIELSEHWMEWPDVTAVLAESTAP